MPLPEQPAEQSVHQAVTPDAGILAAAYVDGGASSTAPHWVMLPARLASPCCWPPVKCSASNASLWLRSTPGCRRR